MKITVRADASETVRHFTYYLSDYDMTDEEWEKMSNEERNAKLQEWLDGEPETPVWIVDRYEEKY